MEEIQKSKGIRWGWIILALCALMFVAGGIQLFRKTDYQRGYRMIAIFGSEKISFWEEVRKGLRLEAQERGIVLTEYTPEDESLFPSLIESAYYTDVDAVAICIYESDMWKECQPILRKMREKGIKIIVADTPPKIEDYDAYIGLDNYAIGRKMAENVYQNYVQGERILVRIPDDQENLVLGRRTEGFCDRLKELGLEEFIDAIPISIDTIEGITSLKEQLEGSGVVAAFTTNLTIGVAEIINSEGLSGRIHLVGFGEMTEDAAQYVDAGIVDVFLMQDNQGIGRTVIQAAEALCSGKAQEKRDWDVDVLVYSGEQ